LLFMGASLKNVPFDPARYRLDEEQTKIVVDANNAIEGMRAQCVPSVSLAGCGGFASWTFESYRQLWLRRILCLADGAAAEWSGGRLVNVVVLLRAAHETAAALNHVLERGRDLISADNLRGFHRLVIDTMHSSRVAPYEGQPPLPTATNMLTMIGRMNEELPGTRHAYDILSDLAHPNGEGWWYFGESNKQKHELLLHETADSVALSSATSVEGRPP
jgi:hypothetical protein